MQPEHTSEVESDNRILSKLSQPILFGDPLGSITRKRQVGLLIASTIGLLLSADIAKISDVTVVGIKFEPGREDQLILLIGLFVLYFLINFAVGCRKDWKKQRFTRIPAAVELADFRRAVLARSNQKTENAVQVFEETQRLIKRRKELYSEVDNLPEGERPKRLQEVKEIIANDGLEELIDRQWDSAKDMTSMERAMALSDLTKSVTTSDRLQFLLEILFPILLAVFALASVAYRLMR